MGRPTRSAVVVTICYRPPDQEVDEVFFQLDEAFKQLEEALVLVLMEAFNHPDICQKDNTAGLKQSRFFECTEDNFLAQAIEDPTKMLYWT